MNNKSISTMILEVQKIRKQSAMIEMTIDYLKRLNRSTIDTGRAGLKKEITGLLTTMQLPHNKNIIDRHGFLLTAYNELLEVCAKTPDLIPATHA